MSQSFNGLAWEEFIPSLAGIPSYQKYSAVHVPSEMFVFIDVHEDGILDSLFGMPLWEGMWYDLPANRHSQGCNLSFADGHVEHWRWKSAMTFRYLGQRPFPDEKPDYQRVRKAMRLTPLR